MNVGIKMFVFIFGGGVCMYYVVAAADDRLISILILISWKLEKQYLFYWCQMLLNQKDM